MIIMMTISIIITIIMITTIVLIKIAIIIMITTIILIEDACGESPPHRRAHEQNIHRGRVRAGQGGWASESGGLPVKLRRDFFQRK